MLADSTAVCFESGEAGEGAGVDVGCEVFPRLFNAEKWSQTAANTTRLPTMVPATIHFVARADAAGLVGLSSGGPPQEVKLFSGAKDWAGPRLPRHDGFRHARHGRLGLKFQPNPMGDRQGALRPLRRLLGQAGHDQRRHVG